MSLLVGRCDQRGCVGHLGKFSSCLDEALWELSLDTAGFNCETGSVDAYGHFTAMTFANDEDHMLGSVKVTIPHGWYLVSEDDRGFVYVITCASEAELNTLFNEQGQRYGEWLEINEAG